MIRSNNQATVPKSARAPFAPACSFLWVVFTVSSSRRRRRVVVLVRLRPCTPPPFSSTWPPRCSSWPATPPRTSRSSVSRRVTCSSPFVVMRSSTRSSRPPLRAVVSFRTFTSLSVCVCLCLFSESRLTFILFLFHSQEGRGADCGCQAGQVSVFTDISRESRKVKTKLQSNKEYQHPKIVCF
jgi:hypothetical protein